MGWWRRLQLAARIWWGGRPHRSPYPWLRSWRIAGQQLDEEWLDAHGHEAVPPLSPTRHQRHGSVPHRCGPWCGCPCSVCKMKRVERGAAG